jgi:[ribosomal protein S18]-alanine N-acetyltransferase
MKSPAEERLGCYGMTARVRPMSSADAPAAYRILKESPEASMWNMESLEEWASNGIALVADLDGSIAGILVGRVAADEFEILNLAVATAWRRRGAGAGLVHAALERARSAGAKQVYLEVRASNRAAISLYESIGFRECGRRASYYRDPPEDAVLLVFHTSERNS